MAFLTNLNVIAHWCFVNIGKYKYNF